MTINDVVTQVERARDAMDRALIPAVLRETALNELRTILISDGLSEAPPVAASQLSLLSRQAG